MMSVSFPWIFYVPTLLMILFCIGGIIFTSTRPSEYGRVKMLVIVALSIMLLSRLVFPMTLGLFGGSVGANPALLSGILSILTAAALMFAVALLIAAAFLDRTPSSTQSGWDPGGTPLSDQPNENPYAAPRQ